MEIRDYTLVCGGNACPEQYDVFKNTVLVGYLRLRHGHFTVEVPDVGGECIYDAFPTGDGSFYDDERMMYLEKAIEAIDNARSRTIG
jgi:hypothetical protein